MVYGCYTPYIIYGFNENNREYVIDAAWLEDHYGIGTYAMDIVRETLGEACYGIKCDIDIITGVPNISDSDKQIVNKAYQQFKEYEPTTDSILGYYSVLTGDYNMCQRSYILDDVSDDNYSDI